MSDLRYLLGVFCLLSGGAVRALAGEPAASWSKIADVRAAQPSERVWHVRGTLTLEQGALPTAPLVFYIQDESSGISVASPRPLAARTNNVIDVEGTLHRLSDGEPEIRATRIEIAGKAEPVRARLVDGAAVYRGGYAGQLVRVRDVVVRCGQRDGAEAIFFDEDADGFRAYLRLAQGRQSPFAGRMLTGSLVEVTGIPMPLDKKRWQLRLRDARDLAVLRPPPLVKPLYLGLGLLGVLVLAGGIALWIVTLRRTIRARTAEVCRLLERTEEAARLKSEFLANLSHEIRTPLHGVLGLQAMMLDSPMPAELKEMLQVAHQSSKHLLVLLNDVLEFSRMEAVGFSLTRERFDLHDLLAALGQSTALLAEEKGIRFTSSGEALPRWLLGDPTRLRQVLLNLLNNAVKFTERGRVDLLVEQTSSEPGRAELRFEVRDTGMGIAEDQQELIYEAFRQVDGSIARTHGGSGLGLAIASRLVEKMNGRLTVQSRLGEGSRFSFTLQFDVPEEQAEAPASDTLQESGRRARLRILVAEDNLVNQRLIRGVLGRDGHFFSLVSSGQEAIEQAQSGLFDLILMDVQMPGTDGIEATRAIRALNNPSARTPIVALTALGLAGDRERCLEAGMDDCLAKPFLPQDLLNLIARITEQPARPRL